MFVLRAVIIEKLISVYYFIIESISIYKVLNAYVYIYI
jgi:hypothetical protein